MIMKSNPNGRKTEKKNKLRERREGSVKEKRLSSQVFPLPWIEDRSDQSHQVRHDEEEGKKKKKLSGQRSVRRRGGVGRSS